MGELDVFGGAMRIARVEYPGLDPSHYRTLLDGFAAELDGRRDLDALHAHLFDRLGFRGNAEDYGDPRNSYLNDVLERRTGLPITLSIVYVEVARRLGFEAHGVGFPGHFLARVETPDGPVLVDPFGARVLERDDARELLGSVAPGVSPEHLDAFLAPARPRDILVRMLMNLRRTHAGRGDWARVVRWIDLALEMRGDHADDFRERGLARLRLEDFGGALGDLERYEALAPGAEDLDVVREQARLARRLLSRLN